MNDTNVNRNRGKVFLLAVLILSLITNAALIYDRFQLENQKEKYIAELEETQAGKDSLINEYSSLYDEYEILKTDNDTLSAQLTKEQEKIQDLLNEIKNIKGANRTMIKKYEEELATLRQIMRSFIVQIDSLNTMNENLKSENERIKNSYSEQQNKNELLSEKNEELSETVEKASQLKAVGIKVLGLNFRDKETNKSNKLGKFEVCCQLAENTIAPKGRKSIYIRIARPDGIILSKSPNNRFNYNGDQILYSAVRQVEYNGAQTPVCIYWINDEILIEGKYTVEIFEGGTKIGTSSIELK